MGTSKKLVMASLVSMMLALAFMIGMVPGQNATTAVNASGDGVDMSALLDQILAGGEKGGAVTVDIDSIIDGIVVKTPEDNFQTPEIPVPVQASIVGGTGTEGVRFGANIDGDPTAFTPIANTWVGPALSDEVFAPFAGALDVGSFVTGVANTVTQVALYAFVNPTVAGTKQSALVYEATNAPADAQILTIQEVETLIDNDDNGFPDSPFADIAPGEIWVANIVVDGQVRTVLVANLDGGAKGNLGTIFLSPSGNVQVQTPDLAAFQSAGLIGAGENGLLIVEVVDDLATLLDNVDGDPSQSARQDWADGANAVAPGSLVTGAQFVEISVVYTTGGGATFSEIGDLSGSGLTVDLTLSGLGTPVNDIELHSYPTQVGADGNTLTNEPGSQEWTEIADATVAGNGLTASLTTLSVFAAFDVANLSLTSVSPGSVPAGPNTTVTLTGVIPTAAALSAAEAAAAYTVTIGDTVVDFVEALKGGVAITAYDGVNENQATVTVPGTGITPGPQDVVITDNNDPGNSATLPAGLIIDPSFSISTSVAGDCNGTITLSPPNGPSLPAGSYSDGTVVSVSFTADSGCMLDTFTVDGNPVSGNPIDVTVDHDLTVVANTINIDGLPLTIGTAGSGSGTAQATTAPNANDGVTYLPGTVVGIEATADASSVFSGWTGDTVDIDDPAAAATTITMNAAYSIIANFASAGATYTLTTNVSPAGSGTVTVIGASNPAQLDGSYPAGTVLTVRAVANTGFTFGNWTGNVDDANAATTTITLNQDESITANFAPNAVTIASITPNEAWIFGGVVAMVSGTGLVDGTQVSIGGQVVNGFRAAADGSSIEIVIPATTDATANPTVVVDVQASSPGGTSNTLTDGFTYKRHQTGADGVNTTAFIVADPTGSTDVDVTLGDPHTSFAELILPTLDVPAGTNVFGIARNALNDTTKQNTPAITALGTGGVAVGDVIDNTLDFTLNLYTGEEVKQNTPPAGSAVFPGANAGVFDFGGPVDEVGNPTNATPAFLSAPITGSGLTEEDFGDSVTFWGSAVEYDYVSEMATSSDPEIVEYQSEILNDEVTPAIVKGTDEPDALMMARLYSLNGFSLRQNAIITADLAEAIRLDTDSGTANGTVDGGNTVTIVSRGGGIGHVNRIELVEVVNASKIVGGTILPANFVTPVGTDEFSLTVTMPPSDDPGIVDFVIYGEAAPNTPIVTLERVYEYKDESTPITPFVLLLLGVLLAILGLAAGGDSGGGGGGPCFIATAAYGTPLAAEIDTLRGVRDTYLLDNVAGTAFTDAYYHVSPWIADAVAANPMLASVVRMLLLPVIFFGKIALQAPALATFIMLSIGMMYILRRRARSQG